MPLLMIDAEKPPFPDEADVVVAGGAVATARVARGQLLAIRDVDGGQPAGLFAVVAGGTNLFLSPHHTRVFSNSFMLRLGMRLVTNKRRPALVLGVSADHLRHDLLMPLTEASIAGEEGGADRVRRKIRAAFVEEGVALEKVPDPVNLFLDVGVQGDGRLAPRGVSSRPGDTVVFRAVANLVIAVASPHADPRLWSRAQPGTIAIRIRNHLDSLTDWIKPKEL